MSVADQPRTTRRRRFEMPHIYIILLSFIALAAVATYLVPGGRYERVEGPEGRTTIDPNSFEFIEANRTTLTDFMLAIPQGLISAGEVVFFTLMIGGVFMVLHATGIIELAVARLSRRFARRGLLMLGILMTIFALIATLIGTQELSLVYVPVILPLIIALKYDSVVAAAVALCATTVGFAAGVLNPINTGLAQTLSDVPLFSGALMRIAVLVAALAVAMFFVMRYATKIRRDPSRSLLADDEAEAIKREEYQKDSSTLPIPVATGRQKAASVASLLFLALLVYGVLAQGWFMLEMAGLFIVMGAVVGVIAGLNGTEICEAFNKGFRDVLVGALIAGVARGVAVVLENGQILDTIVHSLGVVVGGLPAALAAIGMFVMQLLFNFVVPSGSGQALVTMPIMAPLADLLDVTRQTAVLAFQLGDGFGNILYPTSGYFMATLALAGVPWQKWVKFFLPMFAGFIVVSLIALLVAQLIGWS
ncbi:YfcC family protein [Brevibacterium sp.]|uniref:YfcC family protein n=1 Tax=Brevibacterium sp. TaxID=1701 RepID=UPI0028124991|nr:YfcC family protein [Brevibacterium sp.]